MIGGDESDGHRLAFGQRHFFRRELESLGIDDDEERHQDGRDEIVGAPAPEIGDQARRGTRQQDADH